jgi:hypothetical protein
LSQAQNKICTWLDAAMINENEKKRPGLKITGAK